MGSEENQWVERGELVGERVDFIGVEGRGLRDESGEWNDYTFAEVLLGEVAPLIITTYVFITI